MFFVRVLAGRAVFSTWNYSSGKSMGYERSDSNTYLLPVTDTETVIRQ
jgi:hypothetical protein